MKPEVLKYHEAQSPEERTICDKLFELINSRFSDAEYKIWHAHPVWFFDGNPIVGYSKLKAGIRLMFWSGSDFDEPKLKPGTGKFKDASITYAHADEVDPVEVNHWLEKSRNIQWDYKNLVKRKGRLERLK